MEDRSREEIEREFSALVDAAFAGTSDEPIIAWTDNLDDHCFVRARFDGRVTADTRRRMRYLRDMVKQMAGGKWTAIAYPGEFEWDYVAKMTARLQARGEWSR